MAGSTCCGRQIIGGCILSDMKVKIKYILCSNSMTNSMLKIYFGIKKDGILHVKDVLKNEKYNRKYRKPFIVDRNEIKRQRKMANNFDKRILIGISCKEKKIENICASIISIANQSINGVSEVVCLNVSEKIKADLIKIADKDLGVKIKIADQYREICDYLEEGMFSYYGEICAGDILHPYTLFYLERQIDKSDESLIIYFDEWHFKKDVKKSFENNYKSDFSFLTFYSKNIIGDFFFVDAESFKKLGGYDIKKKSAKYYDYVLRFTEQKNLISDDAANRYIIHITEPMYYKKYSDITREEKIEKDVLEIEALNEHMERRRLEVRISYDDETFQRHIFYPIKKKEKVSIIIPNKEHKNDLKRCIDSIRKKTKYTNYDIVIVENGSQSDEIKQYYKEISKQSGIKVIEWDKGFNFSAINNYGVKNADGEYIILLNNDVEIISESWIDEMLTYAQLSEVGAVGCMLYYPDDTVQHAGVILGIGGVAGHSHKHFKSSQGGYNDRMLYPQELSAVTAACMMTQKETYLKAGGLDERFQVAFNDIDYCMQVRKMGLKVVFTPYAKLYHYESISRGYETTEAKEKRFRSETELFLNKWEVELEKGDSYYNPHLTLRYENFELK